MPDTTPPFGTYTLPARREALRVRADRCADNQLGRWGISYYRKRALKNLPGPFDIEVMPGVKARLYPRTNRCEKRAIAGQHIWDAHERTALGFALENTQIEPFVFLDVGANVGLYSLIVAAKAKALQKKTRIIAVEPDPTNRARLLFNIKASQAAVDALSCAVSGQAGEGVMGGGENNRGEVRLVEGTGETTPIKTLYQICTQKKLTRIDALKLDIEGHDERALAVFLKQAPKPLWPQLLILETGRAAQTPLLDLCLMHGYTITKRAGINSILTRNIQVRTT